MNRESDHIIFNVEEIPARRETIYPEPFKEGFEGRLKRSLTAALGLSQFGVNVVVLEPGSRTAMRHWHKNEDECIYVLEGEVVLQNNAGETVLTPGMAVGFPAGREDGHCIVNKSGEPAKILEVGARCDNEEAQYPDIDLVAKKVDGAFFFYHKDGTPYK